tara:strand:+ start:506 stop:712 length:207 start_codon:yes stop_codon:yes gene_type:complete
MTVSTIQELPFTMNVLYANRPIETETFATKNQAISAAKEESKWEMTVHATVTDERTGKDVFDIAGEQQ